MAENIVVNGQQAYEEDYARAMSDPEFRALYEHEAQKKELWLQLVLAFRLKYIRTSDHRTMLMKRHLGKKGLSPCGGSAEKSKVQEKQE